eukprot:TRINITY_DN11473_c0_g1_i1.p1 TRINITY_DN11473_c0_g1~~TRINITY_DN11473_c0_g1_i1.p1  ORF type:complete len:1078 (+),score=154.72 TRINITY_DN11473_c0_g1_i1:45-3278(+)
MASRGKDGPAAALATRPLTPSSVFVRVRPITETGGGHTDGEAVNKRLASYDEGSLTVKDDGAGMVDKFEVTKVVPPEAQQQEAFDTMMPDLLESFKSNQNVFFFAYGQTGSGKTHTMLGEIDSLASETPVPGWGIFPRVVHSTLESMKQWRSSGVHSILLVSAVEFYCMAAFDLNSKYRNAKNEVTLDNQANVFGTKSKIVKSVKGLRKWICRMYANRTTAKTNMNDASSRSHCAFILTLHKVSADDLYSKTTFSIIDMAGSERSSKTGGEHVNVLQAWQEAAGMLEAGTPELLSIGAQGTFINHEISMITTEIQKATDMHKKGMPYKAAKEASTAASLYFCACWDGRARLGTCVTVSSSPQHGFETWFSLKFAQQLASCRVPLSTVKCIPFAQALETAAQEAEEADTRFSKMDKNPQGPKQYRVFCLASGAATHSAETLQHLQKIADMKSGQSDVDGGSESDGPWQSPLLQRKKNVVEAPQQSALELGKINENFQVFIRIRPLVNREVKASAANCLVVSDVENFPRDPPPQRITVQDAADQDAKGTFVFNRVFDDSHGQADIYRDTAQPYVADFLNGTNVTIFAYGQTGTGKTYTIAGPPQDPGLIQRCLSDVFAGLSATGKDLYYEYVQLYLEGFKDLLVAEPKTQVKVVDTKDGGVVVQNVCCQKASSASQILKDLEVGATRRATRAQDMNDVSSRSHAILMLRLVEAGGDPSQAEASMFIVDLAGSERTQRSGVSGKGFEEATSINQSLTALGRVVLALIEGQKYVPYNSHPLTSILKTGLGGNSKTALIACVTQAADSMMESMNTLRFAMQASHVKNKVAKKDAQDKAEQEKADIEDNGNVPNLNGGLGTIPLDQGPLDVLGSWAGPERVVIVIGDLNSELEDLRGVVDAIAARQCSVLAPKLPGKTQKEVDGDVEKIIALLDWLGVAKPVFYGRDFGAMIACRFKVRHTSRAATLVLEERATKIGPAEYKELQKKDAMKAYGAGCFLWLMDNTYPKTADGFSSFGTNMQGFKGKVVLLWPYQTSGKHDPKMKGFGLTMANGVAKMFKTKPIDSYMMSDDDVADKIRSCFKT